MYNGEPLHTVTGNTTTLTATDHLPISAECINSGGNTNNNTLEIRVASINRNGQLHTSPVFKNITGANVGVICKYGAGSLQRIIINEIGTSFNIYDGLSAAGAIIGSIKLTKAIYPISLEYALPFSTGLTIATVGAATDLTIIYE
jgi:hypothetical protein